MDKPVTIQIGTNSPISVTWRSGMNAQDALEGAYDEIRDSSRFSFALQFFGSYQDSPLGYMVVMLNGTYDSPDQHKYWAMLVDGKLATKGIDQTVLGPGTAVAFVNEPYVKAKHRGTTVAVKHAYYQSSGKR